MKNRKIGYSILKRPEESYRVSITIDTEWQPSLTKDMGDILYRLDWLWQVVSREGHSLTYEKDKEKSQQATINALRFIMKNGSDTQFIVDRLELLYEITNLVWLDEFAFKVFRQVLSAIQKKRYDEAMDKVKFLRPLASQELIERKPVKWYPLYLGREKK